MKNLKKVGLTALAASLATVSVNAGELSVSGGASIGWTSKEKGNSSGWYMNDKIVFTGTGELDNGLGFEMKLSIDEGDVAADQAATGRTFEGRSIKLTSDTLGSLTFQGKDGTGVTGAYDEVLPTVYEEITYAATNQPNDGPNTADSFYYSNSTIDGVQLDVSYDPGGSGTSQDAGTIEYGAKITAVDGLLVGFAYGDDNSTIDVDADNTMMFATYSYGPVTVGYQANDYETSAANSDEEFRSAVITASLNDDFSVHVGRSTIEKENDPDDQKVTSFGAAYSMGSMAIAIQTSDVKNDNHATDADDSFRTNELNISFAF